MKNITSEYLPKEIKEHLEGRFAERKGDVLSVQIEECMRFLYLASKNGGSKFMPLTQESDDVWHELILQTVFYAELCDRLPGNKFLHHTSLAFKDYAGEIGVEKSIGELLSWIPDYVQTFGRFTEESARCWSFCLYLMNEMGLDLESINTAGESKTGGRSADSVDNK
ncbi:hypothetical protein [Nocardiopsis kunsanensis]|uniref:hypothetical protein n=1 Tax=Nocardiopsis kunsanensis TaxID=141693 RepID=UPI001267DA31|nr:hypothetical protein [Nocardiopsis kunsanensis]